MCVRVCECDFSLVCVRVIFLELETIEKLLFQRVHLQNMWAVAGHEGDTLSIRAKSFHG